MQMCRLDVFADEKWCAYKALPCILSHFFLSHTFLPIYILHWIPTFVSTLVHECKALATHMPPCSHSTQSTTQYSYMNGQGCQRASCQASSWPGEECPAPLPTRALGRHGGAQAPPRATSASTCTAQHPRRHPSHAAASTSERPRYSCQPKENAHPAPPGR